MEVFNVEADVRDSLETMEDEELVSFSKLVEDPISDEQIELYIYTCFLLFTRKSTDHLERALNRTKEWIKDLPTGHPDHARRLCILDMLFAWKSQLELNSEQNSEQGRWMSLRVCRQTPRGDQLDAQVYKAARLAGEYEDSRDISQLERAISMVESAIEVMPTPLAWSCLAGMLSRRYARTRSKDDLDHAIQIANTAWESVPRNRPDRADLLANVYICYAESFNQTGSLVHLDRAIEVMEAVVEATPQGHPEQPNRLTSLGLQIGKRFGKTGSVDDLNRTIEVTDAAINITPEGHPDRPSMLDGLGYWLAKRFKLTGSGEDLEFAIRVAESAVKAAHLDHLNLPRWLGNLGHWLSLRHESTGSISDLNRAIDVTETAVNTASQGHPGWLSNLGYWLTIRFERTGSMDDLDRAIEVADTALVFTPEEDPERSSRAVNLGVCFSRRFERTGTVDDLDRSIEVTEMAVKIMSQDHFGRSAMLSNLGMSLMKRFEYSGSVKDLDRAVELAEMAVDIRSPEQSDRPSSLANLGLCLSKRFRQTGSMDDMNRAIEFTDMAIKATSQDNPNRAQWLSNLGQDFRLRFYQTNSADDLSRGLSSFKEGWSCISAAPSVRIYLARQAAELLTWDSKWEEASNLLHDAVKLLPTVSPRSLKHTDKQHVLSDAAGLASTAAAVALNAKKGPYHALQLLELSRGVIAGLLMEMRGDISDLKRKHPGLAKEFISLRDELDSLMDSTAFYTSSGSTSSWESRVRRRREADDEFTKIIARIREQRGFQNFLLPPTAEELMMTADPDPIIVVNSSPYRSDAFLVESTQIRVLELPDLTTEKVQELAENLRRSRLTASSHVSPPVLEWLWDAVCFPSLEALGFKSSVSDDKWPRVWWIPTGRLSQFPLHAAGKYLPGSTETVLDRVMSSYASSIKALRHGRRQAHSNTKTVSDRALLVAMSKTPGLEGDGALPFAAAEVEMLSSLCPSLKLKAVESTLRKEEVLQHLPECRIFHFAGHGRSDPSEPSQSCLLLEDCSLTVGDLRDYRLQENPPFLGYLSACSTGANEKEDLDDEGIHLISAFQLAGFQHVVRTLWEVSDKHCVDVAGILYNTLRDEGMTDIAVCRGLHRAVRALRDGQTEAGQAARKAVFLGSEVSEQSLVNSYWIPYVHFGV
ncbi:hypothetical protein IL306_013445 [Fusarium sp. DS 682]|nr:hypothetical protein IL306_013445 [Fusarium sp. DS 682]